MCYLLEPIKYIIQGKKTIQGDSYVARNFEIQ